MPPHIQTPISTNHDQPLINLGLAAAPGASHTNFHVPENTTFYSSYLYLPLDQHRREIRLLKVYPKRRTCAEHLADHPHWLNGRSNTSDSKSAADSTQIMIACEIVDKVPLSKVYGRYRALSYCAGNLANPAQILVNGFVFNIFANLYHAIECTLRYVKLDGIGPEVLLWVDQICINQSDNDERGVQVGLMRDIYRQSDEALVCLSTPGSVACDGLMWARALEEPSLYASNYAMAGTQDGDGLYPTGLEVALWENTLSKQGHVILIKWLESLAHFIKAPWWRRSWVYQEFAVAPQVQILYNHRSKIWATLPPLLDFIVGELQTRMVSWSFNFSDDHTRSSFDRKLAQMQEYQDKLDTTDEKMVEKLKSHRRKLYEMNQELGIRQSYHHSLRGEESFVETKIRWKERDIQNTSDKSARDKLKKQLEELRNKLKMDIRNQDEEFNVDMEKIREKWADHVLFPRSKEYTRKAAGAGLRILKGGLAKLKSELRTLDSMRQARSGSQTPKELKQLLQHARNCQSSDPRDRVYAFLSLAYSEYGIVPNYSSSNNVAIVFVDVCQRIIEFDSNLSVLEHAALARRELGCFLPSWVPDWTSPVDYNFRYECARVAGIELDTSQDFTVQMTRTIPTEYRADVDGRVSYLGLKVVGVCLGVVDSYFDSAPASHNTSRDSIHVQKLKTVSGHNVFTGRQARLDDEIWLIVGAAWPVVLRCETDSDYILLGEALLLGDGKSSAADTSYVSSTVNGITQGAVVTKDIYLI